MNSSETIINLIRLVWTSGNFTRKEYRQKRQEETEINLPSCHKIDEVFGSFGKMKEKVIQSSGKKLSNGNSKLRERVKKKRSELFNNKKTCGSLLNDGYLKSILEKYKIKDKING